MNLESIHTVFFSVDSDVRERRNVAYVLRATAYKYGPKNGTSHFLPTDRPQLENTPTTLVSANAAFFGRNLRKPISPQLSSKSTSGYAEFCEDLIASRAAQQLLENFRSLHWFLHCIVIHSGLLRATVYNMDEKSILLIFCPKLAPARKQRDHS